MLLRLALALDDPARQEHMAALLTQPDLAVTLLKEGDLLTRRAARGPWDLMVVSRSLVPRPATGTVRLLRELPDSPRVVIMSPEEDPEERAALLAAGCDAVLYEGLSDDLLMGVLSTILERRRRIVEERLARGRAIVKPQLGDFVSASPAMQAFMSVVRRVVRSNASLLILGETGVGKERLARAIHAEGPRSQGPFVTINCGALPETLLESELFGHEEGSFTGATRARRGLFELAHRGTVFLDEIGELPTHLQVKLLRAIQEREILRLGSEGPITVDVRVMAATNRNLAIEVEAGHFRRDLYYRLSVVTLTVPPLRGRREDIGPLVEDYIGYFTPRIGREVRGIADDALEALRRYTWPGNVRELINIIERAMLLCTGDRITLDDLPEGVSGRHAPPPAAALLLVPQPPASIPQEWLRKPIKEGRKAAAANFERAYLAALLRECGGRVADTAKRAGLDPRSLHGKMKQFGLRKEDFKP